MWLHDLLLLPSVAHSILLLSIVIAAGLALSRIKIGSISLGVTWVLFVGIIASHFGLTIDSATSHLVKELGLILFIYSIGMDVGPSFFSSFRKGGLSLNLLALLLIALGSLTAYIIHLVTGESLTAMTGVLYGAVTNTPGLGAAQQTYSDITGQPNAIFAQGYAVAYPLGVVGIILSIATLRPLLRIKIDNEQQQYNDNRHQNDNQVKALTIEATNPSIYGKSIKETLRISGRKIVITRIKRKDTGTIEMASANSIILQGDHLCLVGQADDANAVSVLIGKTLDTDSTYWDDKSHGELVSARIMVTTPHLQGRRLQDLAIRQTFNVTISRVKRAGIDLVARPDLYLQLGDRLTVVGSASDVSKVEQLVGNAVHRLDAPQLFAIFLGISLGILVGTIPIMLPGIPVPVKLGLAGGPLIISILLSRFGPQMHLVTYSTSSVKQLLREMGICLFMASVGLAAGQGFADTVIHGGLWWILYGFLITTLPCLITGIIARLCFHCNYFAIAGLISGATTDPPALAYANSICDNDQAAVSYATVYPLSMFLRVVIAQILILLAL